MVLTRHPVRLRVHPLICFWVRSTMEVQLILNQLVPSSSLGAPTIERVRFPPWALSCGKIKWSADAGNRLDVLQSDLYPRAFFRWKGLHIGKSAPLETVWAG